MSIKFKVNGNSSISSKVEIASPQGLDTVVVYVPGALRKRAESVDPVDHK